MAASSLLRKLLTALDSACIRIVQAKQPILMPRRSRSISRRGDDDDNREPVSRSSHRDPQYGHDKDHRDRDRDSSHRKRDRSQSRDAEYKEKK